MIGAMTHGGASFLDLFERPARIRTSAPGRVNLIGEHTDYNGGFVLPIAIPLETRVELAPRSDRRVRAWSAQYPQDAPLEYALGDETPTGGWADYLEGVSHVAAQGRAIGGFDVRIDSSVPPGAGLASSAALEIALLRALRVAFDLDLDDVALAKLGRQVETDFVGAPVGIMDQMAASLASADAALFLDTRSLAWTPVPLPRAVAIVVMDSGISHRHAGGEYAVRRRECADASRRLGLSELRDVADGQLEKAIAALPPVLGRRVRHVVTENARVLATVDAFGRGDATAAGRLFNESHASMRDDYEVSLPQIDAIVEAATHVDGVYGARLTGGGFGGSIVALVDEARAADAARAIMHTGRTTLGLAARAIVPRLTSY
jgi:galactokinase